MLTLSNMLPATDTVDENYVRKLLENDEYHFTYHIDVKQDVDMDMFKTLDTQPLGRNVSISVRKFSDEAFTDRKYHPEKRSIADKEGLIDEYYSYMTEDDQGSDNEDSPDYNDDEQAGSKHDEYVSGDANMLELIRGDWEIMDDGETIQEPGMKRDRLRFSLPKDHRVKFITAGGDDESFDFELTDVFETPGNTYDRLTLSNCEGSGKYDWDEVRPEQSFQIMIANNLGHDYIMLRELGDERTGFATYGLRYDRSISGTWMLRRPDPNDYDEELAAETTTPSTVGIEDEVRQKDTSFHAIKWIEFGNSCTLQRVEIIPTTVELDGGGPYDALEYCLSDDEYAYSAVNYEYKGNEDMAHGGYFDPALVYVTTDKEGRIIGMSRLDYAINGAYYDTGEMVYNCP